MPATIPDEANDLVTSRIPAIVSYQDDAEHIVSIPLWVEHDAGVLRFSTVKGSKKTRHLRPGSQVAVTFTDAANPYRYLSISGQVGEIHDDVDLATIDRLAHRYVGGPYAMRERARDVVVIEPSRVQFSPGTWG